MIFLNLLPGGIIKSHFLEPLDPIKRQRLQGRPMIQTPAGFDLDKKIFSMPPRHNIDFPEAGPIIGGHGAETVGL